MNSENLQRVITEEDFIDPENVFSGKDWVKAFNDFQRMGFTITDQAVDLATVMKKARNDKALKDAQVIMRRLGFQRFLWNQKPSSER